MAAGVVVACSSDATGIATTANVGSVSITPASTTVSVGAQVPLHALVQDPSGRTITGTDILWSAQSPGIATVSNTGVVTGVAPGSTEVAASVNGTSAIAVITVDKTPVTSVVVTPPHVDAAPGVQAQLSATAYDAAQNPLSGRAMTWSTSNAGVATVDANGMMTAVGTGSATITATSEGKSGTAAVTISNVAVGSVTVQPQGGSIPQGTTSQLSATVRDVHGNILTDRGVTWSSSNTAIATVNAGVVTGVAVGTATITATSEGKSGSATLTVNPVPVSSVTITPPSPDTVFIGSTTQAAAVTKDSAGNVLTGRVVTWQSSNTAVATVGATGLVTGVAVGTTTITATSEGKSGAITLASIKVPVGSVTVAPSVDSVTTTGSRSTKPLAATVKDVNGTVVTDRVVNWTSTPGSVASVFPSSGASTTVTGGSVGQAQVIATSETKTATASIKVIQAVTSVSISPSIAALSLVLSPTVQLTATATAADNTTVLGRTIAWSSDNASVAIVDATGKVTAKAVGLANITATVVFDGVASAITATITVIP